MVEIPVIASVATHCAPTPRDTPSDAVVPLSHCDEHLLHRLGGCHASAGQPCVLQLWDDVGCSADTQLLASTTMPLVDTHCTLRVDVPPPHVTEQSLHDPVHHEYCVGAGPVPLTTERVGVNDLLALRDDDSDIVGVELSDGDGDVLSDGDDDGDSENDSDPDSESVGDVDSVPLGGYPSRCPRR